VRARSRGALADFDDRGGLPGGTHLRGWVLRGLVLRESLVLEHVHQRRLTGVVETLGEWEREAGRRASGAAISI
jgi:hypothetical protein